MQSQEEVFRALLYWLYATRNLSIHTGVFSGPADMQTAHAARGVVDMTLEFLGNWRANELSRHLAQTLPLDIVRELASRRDDLDLHLVSATNCHPLSVSNITGPDVDIWTRP
jgi:hypothetical protein